MLLKSAKADSQHHQDWAQPFKRHIRRLTHRVFLFFPAVSCNCLSLSYKQTKKLSRQLESTFFAIQPSLGESPMSLQTHTGYQTPLQSDVSLHSAPMAANHSASPGCTPSALVWVTLATMCRLALTLARAPSHPLHHSPVLRQLLPRGSWHGTAEHSCGATARIRAQEARTQHKPFPWFSGRSHFQDILNTVLTSTWPTPIKMFAGYVDQT